MKGRSRPKRFVTGDLHFSRLGVWAWRLSRA